MFAFIGSLLQSTISGVLTPLFTYLGKKQDVNLAEYQAMTATERDEYTAFVTGLNNSNIEKIQANSWSGAHFMIYLFGLPAALHWGAVFLVSTFPTYMPYKIPALPASYADAELKIALSFFILAPTLPIVTSVAGMLNRRG